MSRYATRILEALSYLEITLTACFDIWYPTGISNRYLG